GSARRLECQPLLSHPGRSRLLRAFPGAGGPTRPVPVDRPQRHRRLQLPLPFVLRGQRPLHLLGAPPERALLAGGRAGRMDVRVLLLPAVAGGPSPDPPRPMDSPHPLVLGPAAHRTDGEERRPLPPVLPAQPLGKLLLRLHVPLLPAGDPRQPGSRGEEGPPLLPLATCPGACGPGGGSGPGPHLPP